MKNMPLHHTHARRNIMPIAAILLMLALPAKLLAQLPLTDQISSNFITSFAEDPQGYIWIGTNHGLNRFSGSNYAVYYSKKDSTALNSDYISNLLSDEDNRLWMSNECGLCVWENGAFRHLQNVGFDPIARLLDLDRESLIITDRKGIAKVNKQTLRPEKYFPQAGMNMVEAITIASDRKIWFFFYVTAATEISPPAPRDALAMRAAPVHQNRVAPPAGA